MKPLREISREVYGGGDGRAINRHCVRTYTDENGNLFQLGQNLSGCPPFFEAHGPFRAGHEGRLPRLRVNGKEYWGDGIGWKRAEAAFFKAVDPLGPSRLAGSYIHLLDEG